jgi:hypothetical protein
MTSPLGAGTLRLTAEIAGNDEELPPMSLDCGRTSAHDDMGKPEVNITYEDIRRAAAGNDMTVAEALAMMARTAEQDRREHPIRVSARQAGPGVVA